MAESEPRLRRLPGRWPRLVLAVLPFVGLCAVIPLVNRITPYVLGLPFFLFWIALWSVLTSVCMAGVYLLDPRNREGDR